MLRKSIGLTVAGSGRAQLRRRSTEGQSTDPKLVLVMAALPALPAGVDSLADGLFLELCPDFVFFTGKFGAATLLHT